MYRFLFSLVLRRLDAERAHGLALVVIRAVGLPVIGGLVRRWSRPRRDVAVHALGSRFETPFGVAAGFDKDARGVLGLGNLGFGHVEVGTVTARPQPGNARPRLFRLIPDRAVVNRMGFNNEGADAAARRLRAVRRHPHRPVVGVNVGKSRVVPVEEAVEDYRLSTRAVAPHADYLAVNVSSPNTPGLRGLQEADRLEPLLRAVLEEAGPTPVVAKISPDLEDDEIRRIADLAVRLGLAGLIATNTTLARDGLDTPSATVDAAGEGGLSGAPLAERSLAVLRLLRRVVPEDFCLVSVGGVEDAIDVVERLEAGATLVQGYTGFLYRGPGWARALTRGVERLRS